MDEKQDESQVLETETTEEATEQPAEIEEKVELTKAEADELRKKAAERDDLEKKNKQLFERVKKQDKPKDDLSTKDVLYLSKADIHADDVEDVLSEAKLRGVSVKEAHEFMQPILDVRNEQRRTALATSTRSPRGTSKVTGEDLLAKAEKTGELPDSDEGMEALAAARQARLRPGRK